MTFDEAIGFITQELNLGPLSSDDAGHCSITFDGDMAVELFPWNGGEELMFWSTLMSLDEEGMLSTEDFKKLLELNGPAIKYHEEVITIDRDANALVLYRALALNHVTQDALIEHLESFLNNLEFWLNIVKKESSTSSDTGSPFLILP
ncbi:MAG TPA: hypothetical protein DIU37_03255 [Opitutae bacterium]|nr:hypothetical protein [Opitutae bacterium]|tara:strand:+ start:3000 stop:3443 length:444 start_codon:yes stop_codon:yes gene_type:complete